MYSHIDIMEIKVFGKNAKQIKPGDIFIASCGSVEGRDVVILKPQSEVNVEEELNKFRRLLK